MPLPPYKKTKEWDEHETAPVGSMTGSRDRSGVPKNHRSIGKLQTHKRTERTGSKPDTGGPGRPKGW